MQQFSKFVIEMGGRWEEAARENLQFLLRCYLCMHHVLFHSSSCFFWAIQFITVGFSVLFFNSFSCFLSCMWPSLPEQRILQSSSALHLPFRFQRLTMWRGDSRTRVSSSWPCGCPPAPSKLSSEKDRQCRERRVYKREATAYHAEATSWVSCSPLHIGAVFFIN